MTAIVDLVVAAASGGTGTIVLQNLTGWFKARGELRRGDREVDAKLEEHRDQLTFDLLTAARDEMSALRSELAELRPASARVAHLEEALDHIHALLHAEGEIERKAAERRAKAYLRRMRPEIGDLRNSAQAALSAKSVTERVVGDLTEDKE